MMDADACVPLPENVARGLSPFHRLMRSHYIGMIVMTVVLLFLAVQPLFAVGPVLLFLTWIGVFSVRGMQRFLDFASGLYMAIGLFLVENLFGIRIHTFGHPEKFKQRSLFIMNHVCHFDWLFFWGVLERNGDLTCWKAITKNIKNFPFMGLCMQYMCNVFISRRWENDEMEFKKKLFYYNAIDLPVQLLLFPEGGDLTGRSRAKSHSYADTNNLERYEYCLHPRAKGFLYVIEALRSGRLDAVYDITVAYPDALAKTEADFARGECTPRDIHYYIHCYKVEDLPADEEGLTRWLAERWREKEKDLKLFYAHRHFVEPVEKPEERISRHNGHTEYRSIPEVVLPKPHLFTAFAFAFFIFLTVVLIYLFLHYRTWALCVVGMAVWTFVKGLGSGIDIILPDLIDSRIEAAHNKYCKMKDAIAHTHRK